MIHFFLSIIYAEPQEIGLDVTMKLLDDGRNYDIAVQGFDGTSRTYRTQELFFSQHPSQLINKVTRVWAAVRVENGQACGDTVVLKDCWTGRTSLPEPMLLEKMHNSPPPAAVSTARMFFIRPCRRLGRRIHGRYPRHGGLYSSVQSDRYMGCVSGG